MHTPLHAPRQAKEQFAAAHSNTARTAAQGRGLADKRPEAVAQRKLAAMIDDSPRVLQQQALSKAIRGNAWKAGQRDEQAGNGALPAQLKSGIESLSGMRMDHVKVHYNSAKPAQLHAHAYAQGSEIHLGPGQEKHLPHEAWHVVQQAQGRVRPTMQMKHGRQINNDAGLEREADAMGERALGAAQLARYGSAAMPDATRPAPGMGAHGTASVAQLIEKNKLGLSSANGMYMINRDNTKVLYGMTASQKPSPAGLYVETEEKVTGDGNEYSVKKWTPNVILFSKDRQLGFTSAHDENRENNKEDHNRQSFFDWIKGNKTKYEINDAQINAAWLEAIKLDKRSIAAAMELGARIGILGNNDCALFARTLHHLIRDEIESREKEAVTEFGEFASGPRMGDDPVVGSMLQHKFPAGLSDCGYHGVTVVAKDGETLITLEAHASRQKMNKPDFEMRKGVNGFKEDNFPLGMSKEHAKLWKASHVIVEHPDKKSKLHLGGGLDLYQKNYRELDELDRPVTSQDIGISMSTIGVTSRPE